MDGRTDGRTDGRMDGWIDRWMDGNLSCLKGLLNAVQKEKCKSQELGTVALEGQYTSCPIANDLTCMLLCSE